MIIYEINTLITHANEVEVGVEINFEVHVFLNPSVCSSHFEGLPKIPDKLLKNYCTLRG